MIKINIV